MRETTGIESGAHYPDQGFCAICCELWPCAIVRGPSQPLVAHDAQMVERYRPMMRESESLGIPSPAMGRDPEGGYVRHADYLALSAKLAEADARLATLQKEHEDAKALIKRSWERECALERERAELAESSLSALRESYQRMLGLCENHQPDRWEGDGSCVLCEGHQIARDLSALRAAVSEYFDAWATPEALLGAGERLRALIQQRGASPR